MISSFIIIFKLRRAVVLQCIMRLQSVFGIVTCSAVGASIRLPSVTAQTLSEGDCICREGIIMDNFCINRGTLLDNSRVRTLVGPELHSQHCLLDVGVCVRSGYSVLGDPDLPGGLHSVAAQFDADGNDMVFDFAARSGARGACRDCTGELDSVRSGFRASVVGVVESAGDANSNDPLGRAPSIKVTDVRRSSEGCSNFSCPAGPSQAARPPPTASPTAAPIAAPAPIALAPAGRPVDCNEVQTEVVLSESPRFTLSYVVNIPDTDSNADISATEADAGGFIDVQLTYEGVGYVAFGPSPTGLMPGGQVVICLPDDGDVSKYMMADRNQLAVNRMTGEQQTLIDAEVTQEDGVTTCRFRKLLVEPGEHAIESNAVNSFVWATGGINALSYHRGRGAIELPLEACTSAGVGSVEVIRAADPFEQYWRAHGILMGLAWGLFAPVAIVSAVCRRLIPGNGTWYKIHRTMNSLCFIFTVIGFAVAVAAFNGAGIDHFQFRHHQIGLTMFIVVIFQVVGGARRPHLPSPAAPSKLVQDSSKETEEEGLGAAGQTPRLSSAAAGPEPKKSTIRVAWEISHRIVGLILLVLGLSNGFTGLQLLAVRTGTESDYTNVWWGVVGTIIGIGICGAIYDRLISKSPESDSKNAHDSQRRLGLRASV